MTLDEAAIKLVEHFEDDPNIMQVCAGEDENGVETIFIRAHLPGDFYILELDGRWLGFPIVVTEYEEWHLLGACSG